MTSPTDIASPLPTVRPSINKCFSKRTLQQLARRAGHNNKISPEARVQTRHAIDCFLDELIGDAVVFLECGRDSARTLKLSHVNMALERRGITLCGIELCGIEPVARRPVVADAKAKAK